MQSSSISLIVTGSNTRSIRTCLIPQVLGQLLVEDIVVLYIIRLVVQLPSLDKLKYNSTKIKKSCSSRTKVLIPLYSLKIKELDDEEAECIAMREPIYRVETGNYEYRLVLRCRWVLYLCSRCMRGVNINISIKIRITDLYLSLRYQYVYRFFVSCCRNSFHIWSFIFVFVSKDKFLVLD